MHLTVAEIRKTIVAVLGFAAEAVSLGVLTGTAAHVVTVIVGALTTIGVFVVPNTKAAPVLLEAEQIAKSAFAKPKTVTVKVQADTTQFHAALADAVSAAQAAAPVLASVVPTVVKVPDVATTPPPVV